MAWDYKDCPAKEATKIVPPRLQTVVTKYRSYPAGQLVMRLYEKHRDLGPVTDMLIDSTDPKLYPPPPSA